jgi:hypothetical protein
MKVDAILVLPHGLSACVTSHEVSANTHEVIFGGGFDFVRGVALTGGCGHLSIAVSFVTESGRAIAEGVDFAKVFEKHVGEGPVAATGEGFAVGAGGLGKVEPWKPDGGLALLTRLTVSRCHCEYERIAIIRPNPIVIRRLHPMGWHRSPADLLLD